MIMLSTSVRNRSSLSRLIACRPTHSSIQTHRSFAFTSKLTQTYESPAAQPRPNFYRTHGRPLAKCLTLAFFSYQVFYWAWVTLESETMQDEKRLEIKRLEEEVRLLGSGRGSHVLKTEQGDGKRLLEEDGQGKDG